MISLRIINEKQGKADSEIHSSCYHLSTLGLSIGD